MSAIRPSRPKRPEPDIAGITIVPTEKRMRQVVVIGAGGHAVSSRTSSRAVTNRSGEFSLLGVIDDGEPDRPALARSGMRFLGGRSAARWPRRRPTDRSGISPHPQGDRRSPGTTGWIDHSSIRSCRNCSGIVGRDGYCQGAILTTNITIGRHSHVNIGATVSHDCTVGDYVTICPHATITGAASIGDDVFIGAGATVLPGVTIGERAVIGAGAVVSVDVAPDLTVAGVPARQINSPNGHAEQIGRDQHAQQTSGRR